MNLLQSAVALAAKLIDFTVKTSNHVHCLFNRGAKLIRLTLPSSNTIDFGSPAAHFCFDLLAELALGSRRDRLHDELHATRLANPVLLGTVLSEVTPLPVATGEAVLIVEAHVSHFESWGI